MDVLVIKDVAALVEHVKAWDLLAAAAIEPNVFYESWMLLPALDSFGANEDFSFVLIYTRDPAQASGPPLLCGFFPLVRERLPLGLPLRVLALWKHIHCFHCTPLVRAGYAADCLSAFFEWVSSASEATLVKFGTISGEGPFRRALTDELRLGRALSFAETSHTRAILRRWNDGNAYLKNALPGARRSKVKRREQKLSELGKVEYRLLGPGDDVDTWIRQFLECEASGWKGKEKGALACHEDGRKFFVAVVREAFARKKLRFLALHLDGRPIAMSCSFLAPPGGFFFKPAFDEQYSRFGPGVLLEVEKIRTLHSQSEIQWIDSCTDPDNALLNDLWLDRVSIDTIWLSTSGPLSGLIVSLLPLGRWARRMMRKRA